MDTGNYKGPKALYSLCETVVYKGPKALYSLCEIVVYKGPKALLSLYETMCDAPNPALDGVSGGGVTLRDWDSLTFLSQS